MALTDAEVDAAVPAAGTPDRALTNAALKELVTFQTIEEVTSGTGAARPNFLANPDSNEISTAGDGNVITAPGFDVTPNKIGIAYSSVPDRVLATIITQTVPDDDPTVIDADLSGVLMGYDNLINGLANGSVAAQHSIISSRVSHSAIIAGSNHLIDEGDYCAVSHGRFNEIKGSGSGKANSYMVGGEAIAVDFGSDASGYGYAVGRELQIKDLTSIGASGRNVGSLVFGQDVLGFQPGMTWGAGAIAALGDAQCRFIHGSASAVASGWRRMLSGVVEVHLRDDHVYAIEAHFVARTDGGLAACRFAFSAEVDATGTVELRDTVNRAAATGAGTVTADPATNNSDITLNTTSSLADNDLFRVTSSTPNRTDFQFNAAASGDIGTFWASMVEMQKA